MITARQIAALKWLIFKAKNGTDLTKKILAFLIDQSGGLTKEVCLSLIENREGYTADEIDEAAYGCGAMNSSNCTTHLNQILEVLGNGFCFSVHYGDFDLSRKDSPLNNDGQFAGYRENQVQRPGLIREGMPLRYTFWLAREHYSWQATPVIATRENLEKIDLQNLIYIQN